MDSSTPAPAPHTKHTAVAVAVAAGDVRAFRNAEQARRLGKPLPDVTVESTPEKPEPVSPQDVPQYVPGHPEKPRLVSKRQEKTNDTIREAVDRATAELRAENERLKLERTAPLSTQPLPPALRPSDPQKPKEPEFKRFLAMPDAPKLEDFDSIPEHTAAMALFIADHREQERATRSEADHVVASKQARIDRFVTQLTEARAADPDFVTKLTPTVRDRVKPFDALKEGEQNSAFNVVGEYVYDSAIAANVLTYFSTPEGEQALKHLTDMPAHLAGLPASLQVSEHTKWIGKEYGKIEHALEKTARAPHADTTTEELVVPDLPEPPAGNHARATEPTDPAKAAVKRGDVKAFRKIELEKRLARTRR